MNATTVDFTTGTISGVETLMGSYDQRHRRRDDERQRPRDDVRVAMDGIQGSIDLKSGTDVLNVKANGHISTLAVPAMIDNVETGNLTGTTGNDTVMLAGAQLNAIVIGDGTINLGEVARR